MSLNPQYDSNGKQITGYQASNTVSVKIRNVANAGKVIDDVAGLVGDEFTISNVSFTVDDPSKYQDQARAEAIADAKARAETYATAAGVKVGELLQISEVQVQPPIPFTVPKRRPTRLPVRRRCLVARARRRSASTRRSSTS